MSSRTPRHSVGSMVSAPWTVKRPPSCDAAASCPPCSRPSCETWQSASTCVPTWVPRTSRSLAAEPPSARTMSPCRRGRECRYSGWLGDCGIPCCIGRARSKMRTPPSTAASSASLGNGASLLQLGDLLRGEPELGEHVVGVLSEGSAGVPDPPGGRGHPEEHVLLQHRPEHGVRDLEEDLAVDDVAVLDQAGDVVDRGDRC